MILVKLPKPKNPDDFWAFLDSIITLTVVDFHNQIISPVLGAHKSPFTLLANELIYSFYSPLKVAPLSLSFFTVPFPMPSIAKISSSSLTWKSSNVRNPSNKSGRTYWLEILVNIPVPANSVAS